MAVFGGFNGMTRLNDFFTLDTVRCGVCRRLLPVF